MEGQNFRSVNNSCDKENVETQTKPPFLFSYFFFFCRNINEYTLVFAVRPLLYGIGPFRDHAQRNSRVTNSVRALGFVGHRVRLTYILYSRAMYGNSRLDENIDTESDWLIQTDRAQYSTGPILTNKNYPPSVLKKNHPNKIVFVANLLIENLQVKQVLAFTVREK